MRTKLAEQLLTKRIQTGSIPEGDARFIAGTTWGKEAIKHAIDNRKDIQDKIKELRGAGIIKGNAGEWFYDKVRSSPSFWLMVIFGTAGAVLTPALLAGLGVGYGGLAAAGAGAGAAMGLGGGKAKYSA
jgi:hypothetical protein